MDQLINFLRSPAAAGILETLGVRLSELRCEDKPATVLASLPAEQLKVSKITALVNGRPHVLLIVEERAAQ